MIQNSVFRSICDKLSEIIISNPSSWQDKRRFKALLNDYYSYGYKIIGNLLFACAEERIPHELSQLAHCSTFEFNRQVLKLSAAYGYDSNKSLLGVAIWIDVFGISCEFDYSDKVESALEELSDFLEDKNDNSVKRIDLKHGYIEFSVINSGIIIKNIVFEWNDITPKNAAVVIPETIEGKNVVALYPGALNELRYLGYAEIIIPHTVYQIGKPKAKLYEEYERKFSKKPDLYMAFHDYSEITDVSFAEAYSGVDKNDVFAYLRTYDVIKKGFFPLMSSMDKFDYWVRPKNGVWIIDDTLYKYTGTDKSYRVECKTVCSEAFYKSSIEKLIFSENTVNFEKNMIVGCDKLKEIVFLSKNWCFFETMSIQDCAMLNSVQWPRLIDNKNGSIYSKCPHLGDMVINGALMTCKSKEKVMTVDGSVRIINEYAFIDSKTKILIIPKTVEEISRGAFINSNIKVLIFEGMHTKWEAFQWSTRDTYIFAAQGSYVIQNAFFESEKKGRVYLKNTTLLEGVIGDKRNHDELEARLKLLMDRQTDLTLLNKVEDYSKILKTRDDLLERTNEYNLMMVKPSIEGTQLGEQYDKSKHEGVDILTSKEVGGNAENTGKYGYGLGNSDKLDF